MDDIVLRTMEVIKNEELNLISFQDGDSLMDVFRKNFKFWYQRNYSHGYIVHLVGLVGYDISLNIVSQYALKMKKELRIRGSYDV